MNNKQRQKELREQTILLERIERRFIKPYFKEIKRTTNKMAESFTNNPNDLEFTDIMESHELRIGKIFDKNWNVAAKIFSKRMRKQLITKEKKDLQDDFDDKMDEFTKEYSSQKITYVTQTTKNEVKKIVEAGLLAGEGVEEIAKRIRGNSIRYSRYRAHMIARTETHSSANYGNQVAAELTGLKLVKSWISARQERTRLWHRNADRANRNIPMDEPFTVHGEKLDYCGDPKGSANNIINCRCVVAYDEE